jgi:limonene-1,2-epoxide hydrolase
MNQSNVVEKWIKAFNAGDVDALTQLYSKDAINDQVVFTEPVRGRDEIRAMFEIEFQRAKMICIKENILVSGDWVVLEWSDPIGLRGCGFFKIKNGLINLQRGYFDQLTFFKIQNLPIPNNYLDR